MNTNVRENLSLLDKIERLEHIILSNTGEDVFEEVLKLIFVKIFDEKNGKGQFQAGANPEITAVRICELFETAKVRWPRVFTQDSKFALPPQVLHLVVRELAGTSLQGTSLSILDAVLESLLSKSAKGAMGQYFTPRTVIDFCICLLELEDGDTILDPACGSGGFLLHALKVAPKATVLGIDFDVKAFRIARILAGVAGENQVTLSRRNSLDKKAIDLDGDVLLDQQMGAFDDLAVDVVLTNPPFGGDVTDHGTLLQYESARASAKSSVKMPREVLFVERCIQMLKPGGRAAIVVPQGIVANASARFLRDIVARECHVVAVIGLHPYTFLPHTGVKTSVLVLEKKRGRQDADRPTFFAVSGKPGKDSSGRADGSVSDDLGQIAKAFKLWVRSPRKRTESSDRLSLEAVVVPNSFVRKARRLDAEFFAADAADAIDALVEHGARPLRESCPRAALAWRNKQEGTINYVDISSVDNKTGQISVNPIQSDEAPSRASYRLEAGDVLVSTVRPDRNTIGLVTSAEDAVASNGFCVLKPEKISPELLFAFCKTKLFRKMLSRSATATMYPTVGEDDVLDLPLPPIPRATAKKVEESIRRAHEQLNEAKRLIADAVSTMDVYLADIVEGAGTTGEPQSPPEVSAEPYATTAASRRSPRS